MSLGIKEICWEGMIITVDITSCTQPRPAPHCQSPDAGDAFHDEGEAGEVQGDILSITFDGAPNLRITSPLLQSLEDCGALNLDVIAEKIEPQLFEACLDDPH